MQSYSWKIERFVFARRHTTLGAWNFEYENTNKHAQRSKNVTSVTRDLHEINFLRTVGKYFLFFSSDIHMHTNFHTWIVLFDTIRCNVSSLPDTGVYHNFRWFGVATIPTLILCIALWTQFLYLSIDGTITTATKHYIICETIPRACSARLKWLRETTSMFTSSQSVCFLIHSTPHSLCSAS